MVRVQGGEAILQAPAGHPIRVGLGLAGKRLGSKGQARPFGYAAAYDRMLGRWGLGSADKLPIGAGSGSYASPAPLPWGMQRGRGSRITPKSGNRFSDNVMRVERPPCQDV